MIVCYLTRSYYLSLIAIRFFFPGRLVLRGLINSFSGCLGFGSLRIILPWTSDVLRLPTPYSQLFPYITSTHRSARRGHIHRPCRRTTGRQLDCCGGRVQICWRIKVPVFTLKRHLIVFNTHLGTLRRNYLRLRTPERNLAKCPHRRCY